MPITPQAAAAEQARRIVGRMSVAADTLGKRHNFRLNLVIIRGGLCRYDDFFDAAGAVTRISRQAEIAVELGESIAYRLCPVFPSTEVNSADPSTYA